MDEDGPRQAVACLALVEFLAGLTPQFSIFQPVEGEQRAFEPPQLAQRRGEAVLPRVGGELAQLFTRPCSPPNFSAAFTAVSQSLSCVTSCRTNVAAWPSSDASWRPSGSSTSPIMTRAPSAANKRASAAPCPRAPPLMSMTFPLRRSILSSICLKNAGTAYHAMPTAARR